MNKNLFLTASMLVNFINHKHIIDEFKEKLLNIKKSEKTVVDNLRIKKGLIHEENYFKELSKKYKKVKNIKILNKLSKEE